MDDDRIEMSDGFFDIGKESCKALVSFIFADLSKEDGLLDSISRQRWVREKLLHQGQCRSAAYPWTRCHSYRAPQTDLLTSLLHQFSPSSGKRVPIVCWAMDSCPLPRVTPTALLRLTSSPPLRAIISDYLNDLEHMVGTDWLKKIVTEILSRLVSVYVDQLLAR